MSTTDVPDKKRRSDPPSRPTDGDLHWDRFKNKRVDRHYVCVDKTSPYYGVDFYSARGYEVETHRSGGPVAEIGQAQPDGAPVSQLGTVLMSAPADVQERAYRAQQATADTIDRQILRPGGTDGLRGLKGYIAVENQTSAAYIER